MNIDNIPVSKLNPATYNPRKISRQMLKSLKATITEFGMVDPLVVNKDMTIIGGHQRFKACVELGFTEMPCVVLDLMKSKEKALNLALNKVTGEWNRPKLEKLLKEIEAIDIEFTGFDEEEIAKLIEDINIDTPEYDIAPRLMEEYNYIVLFFRETLDFQVAAEHFGLQMMKEDRRDKVGLGKVIDGAAYLRSVDK
jgi:ParB-like chromosome segregation protein Spo0J